jgi:hypothetical protein
MTQKAAIFTLKALYSKGFYRFRYHAGAKKHGMVSTISHGVR